MKIFKFLFKLVAVCLIGYLIFYWYNNSVILKNQKELNKTATNVVENFYSQLALTKKDILSNGEYLDVAIFTDNLKDNLTRKQHTDSEYDFIICEKDIPTYFNVNFKEEYISKTIYTINSNFVNHSFEVTAIKIDNSWYIDNINCLNK